MHRYNIAALNWIFALVSVRHTFHISSFLQSILITVEACMHLKIILRIRKDVSNFMEIWKNIGWKYYEIFPCNARFFQTQTLFDWLILINEQVKYTLNLKALEIFMAIKTYSFWVQEYVFRFILRTSNLFCLPGLPFTV